MGPGRQQLLRRHLIWVGPVGDSSALRRSSWIVSYDWSRCGTIGCRAHERTSVLSDRRVDEFTAFVEDTEPKLKLALCANFGKDLGMEATAEALAFAWEHWDRVTATPNPAGYLYGVGRNVARKRVQRRHPQFAKAPEHHTPWVEPGLPAALAGLPERQRVAVMLVHCFEWTLSEVAELMEVSKPTVQKHVDRGMAKLRRQIGADDEH